MAPTSTSPKRVVAIPGREDAEAGSGARAEEKKEVVVHDQDGKAHRRKARRGWFSRLFG
jgi:hypothetical protein